MANIRSAPIKSDIWGSWTYNPVGIFRTEWWKSFSLINILAPKLGPPLKQARSNTSLLTKSQAQFQRDLLAKFLNYKRPNLSLPTFVLYEYCLKSLVGRYWISAEGINSFLADFNCGNAKANYHQIITTFVRWLLKMGYLQQNLLDKVDKPKRFTWQSASMLTFVQKSVLLLLGHSVVVGVWDNK